MVGVPECEPGEELLLADGLEIPRIKPHIHAERIGAVGNALMRMTIEQPTFGGRRHIGELVPVFRPVAVFFGQCREPGEVLMPMVCRAVAAVGLPVPSRTGSSMSISR